MSVAIDHLSHCVVYQESQTKLPRWISEVPSKYLNLWRMESFIENVIKENINNKDGIGKQGQDSEFGYFNDTLDIFE